MTLEILNIVSVIIQIVLFIALIFVIISLTKYLKMLMAKVDVLEDDFNKFKTRVDPLIDDSRALIQKINKISDKVDDNFKYVTLTVEKIKDTVEDIIDFKDRIVRKAEPPIFETINAFAAIVKGVRTFSDTLKRNRPAGRHHDSDGDNLLFDSTDNGDSEFELKEQFDDINKELNDVRKKLEEMKKV
ncbi:MAG: DUF948 domain-containing protein [Bacteroidetes bacterium]|nr:DUF948 domain-containing protein [Bacteroidota bacterium]